MKLSRVVIPLINDHQISDLCGLSILVLFWSGQVSGEVSESSGTRAVDRRLDSTTFFVFKTSFLKADPNQLNLSKLVNYLSTTLALTRAFDVSYVTVNKPNQTSNVKTFRNFYVITSDHCVD